MSTTRGAPLGVVRLGDPPDEIRRKFKTAVTDSGHEIVHDLKTKPGISNLIEIMAVATGDFDPRDRGALRGQGLRAVQARRGRGRGRAARTVPGALPRAALGRRRVVADARHRGGESGRRRTAHARRACTTGWASPASYVQRRSDFAARAPWQHRADRLAVCAARRHIGANLPHGGTCDRRGRGARSSRPRSHPVRAPDARFVAHLAVARHSWPHALHGTPDARSLVTSGAKGRAGGFGEHSGLRSIRIGRCV